jgi:hypothetical protein
MTALDLTAGGRLTVDPRVTERSAGRMSQMLAEARQGGFRGEEARFRLKETLSTSDAPFSFAHLVNLRNLPLYDETEEQWSQFTTNETVDDFEPTTFQALRYNFAGLEHGKDNGGNRVAPKVAELDTYQYAFGYTQLDAQIAVEKRGFKFGISMERAVSRIGQTVRQLPDDMLRVGRKTDAYVVYRALTEGVTAASQLTAGTDYVTGDAVPANAPVSPQALRVALRQLGSRTDAEGNRIPLAARFYVIVPVGEAEALQYEIDVARDIIRINAQTGTVSGGQAASRTLSRIAGVIESEFVTEGFYMVPATGTTEVPALIRVTLAGYTAPEVYVSNFNGAPIAGGASGDPFQAFSYDNDSVDLKYRQFVNAGLFSEDQVLWSNGSSS